MGSDVSVLRLAALLELFKTSICLLRGGWQLLPPPSGVGSEGLHGRSRWGLPWKSPWLLADRFWKQLGQGREVCGKTWEREGKGDPKQQL